MSPDPPRDAQGAGQPAADGGAKAHESSLGEDPRPGRTRVRTHRPVPQGPAAALHGPCVHLSGDRASTSHTQPAAIGDDGAAAAAGARERMRSEPRERAQGAGQNKFRTKRKATATTISPARRATQSIRRHAASSKQALQTAHMSVKPAAVQSSLRALAIRRRSTSFVS